MSNRKDDMVAVAIDKDKSSQFALRWAADHLLGKGRRVTLIHVKTRSSSMIENGSGSQVSVSDLNSDAAKAVKSQSDSQIKEVFLPFRCFCTRKNIRVNEVVLEEADVVRALCNYVKSNVVENLVVGATPRTGFTLKFKSVDIPGGVTKGAPDFCTVYVINKGKIASIRTATGVPPALPPSQDQNRTHSAPTLPSSSLAGNNSSSSSAYFPPYASYTSCRSQINKGYSDIIKSPFSRNSGISTHGNLVDSSDISFVRSSGIMYMSSTSEDEGSYPCRLSNSSETDNISSINTAFSSRGNNSFGVLSSSSQESGGGISWSSSNSHDEVEAEMRKLKLELKQTMDMYNTACKEAELNKQRAEEQEITEEEEPSAKETARTIIEKEKLKSKAAIEAAQAAQRLAELEVLKRKNVEKKVHKEKREKKKMLDVISNNDVRYRRYTIHEIEAATGGFSMENKIGEGGYGPVYKCYLDHTPVAVKVLHPDAAHGQSQFQQEIEVLSRMRHPNMVLLLGACPDYGCLIYEYMSNGSLEDCLLSRGDKPSLPWQLRFRIAAEIATGLNFLHQAKPEPLVHRDLKPGNILLDRNYVSKISDVGLARLVPPSVADTVTQYRMTATAGTFCYIDPEYQQTGMLGTKSDIYSLGVMLLQIITGKSPMGLTHHVEKAIQRGTFAEMLDPTVPDWPTEEALNFAKLALRCTELRRKDRPDLGQVLPELNRLRALGDEIMPKFDSKLITSNYQSK